MGKKEYGYFKKIIGKFEFKQHYKKFTGRYYYKQHKPIRVVCYLNVEFDFVFLPN